MNGIDEAEVKCYIQPYSLDINIQARLPSPPDFEAFRDQKLVNEELREKGMYHGNAEILEQENDR